MWNNIETEQAAELINKEIGVNPGYFFIGDDDLIKQFDKYWREKKYKMALNLLIDIENLKDLKEYMKENYAKGGGVTKIKSKKRSKFAISRDKDIKAQKPGKRAANKNRETYYEYRENRTDSDLRKKLEWGGTAESSETGQSIGGENVSSMYGRGGHVSKGEMVWKKLSSSDKMNFLIKNFKNQITDRSKEDVVNKTYNFLPKIVKIKLESEYANVEEYAKGSTVKGADYYEQLAVYVQGVGSIYNGTSMKKAIDKANSYLKKNPKAEIVISDEKYGDTYDLNGIMIEEDAMSYAEGGGVSDSDFERDYKKVKQHIKEGYGNIDSGYVESTWENLSDITYSAIDDKLMKRLSKDGLLNYAQGGLTSGWCYSIGGL